MKLAVTGHRPNKLGGYDQSTKDKIYRVAHDELQRIKPTLVITGMALGWDQAIAQACIDLKIPFHAYVPCDNQDRMWPQQARLKYYQLLEMAELVKVVSPGPYDVSKMHVRNMAMVDDSDNLLALWDGFPSGGTFSCVKYAKSKNRAIHNCWKAFINRRQEEMQL